MNNYYFTEEHNLFRQSLREFLDKEVLPKVDTWEEEGKIPRDIWKKMGDMGFLGLGYPAEYGGLDLDFFYDVIFAEETSKCFSGGFTITQLVVQYMSGPYLLKYGSDHLKQKYLPGIISGDLISCIGISEPSAGSDVANIKTTAIKDGDHYVVNGSKTFITNAVYGDFIVTVVKTDPDAGPAGVSLLIIDCNAEGVSARKLKKLGWHASDTAELNFDDVRVPIENLLGDEGKGFYYLMGGLQLERLAGAISGYSSAESALAYALQYMSEREAFGRPINKFQVLRHRVAQLASETEAIKQFVRYCAKMHDDDQYAVKECSMAKLLATELSNKAMTQCLQFFGGYGYMEEYKIARMFRDSRIGTIGGGSSEIMREIIAKMVIDEVSYKTASDSSGNTAKSGKDSVSRESSEKTNPENNNAANNLEGADFIQAIGEKVSTAKPLGHTLKFDFGAEQMFIDGTGAKNAMRMDNSDAECTVSISKSDLAALATGKLNPMTAMMSGKLKIDGDMGVAMKLQTLFS
ncbi:MAG: acyl-CoA dehydrogenase [Limisphaerales bacterium]|jgi:acyl-CoA dehydrogenase